MPVTRISFSVDCSEKSGAARWIGRMSSAPTGPFSSTGSPTTLRMRPSVARPTGTVIGRPVSVTLPPRTRPSVPVIATQRTVDSPEVLGDLEHEADAVVVGLERVEDLGQLAVELHVDDGADDLRDLAVAMSGPWRGVSVLY